LRIVRSALEEIRAHAADGYPYEICGILFGPRGDRRVTEAARAHNLVTERANDRYEIDPRDLIRAQREADQRGLDVVGYYHSHPDHPARPSIFDAERAWAGPLYVIASCNGGVTEAVNGFLAEKDGGPFLEEPLEVEE
jgi:proteasome lid subunit RPN8/RPN11